MEKKVRKGFVQIKNELFDDKELRLEEKGMLAILLSNSDEWLIYENEIITRSSNGRDNSKRLFKQLAEKGYLKKVENDSRDSSGRFTKQKVEVTKGGTWKLTQKSIDLIAENPVESTVLLKTSNGKPVTGNQERETSNGKPVPNNTNIENTKEIIQRNNTNETNRIGNNVPVEVGQEETPPSIKENDTKRYEANKRTFFFEAYEVPTQERIIEYVKQKGYPAQIGISIHKTLLSNNFKDKSGNSIKGIQGYIDAALNDKKKELPSITSIDVISDVKEFMIEVKELNEAAARGYCKMNPSSDYLTNLTYYNEAAKWFFNVKGRTKNEYKKFVVEYLQSNNNQFPSGALFLKLVKGNSEKIIVATENDEKEVYTDKEITEVSSTGKDYFAR